MESDQTLFRAKFPYQPENADEIALQKGDIVELISRIDEAWWEGRVYQTENRGWFPSNFVRELKPKELEKLRKKSEKSSSQKITPKNDQLKESEEKNDWRKDVFKELIDQSKLYLKEVEEVKVLCKKVIKVLEPVGGAFTITKLENSIDLVEKIETKFLQILQSQIETDQIKIGNDLLKEIGEFKRAYCAYFSSHPGAVETLRKEKSRLTQKIDSLRAAWAKPLIRLETFPLKLRDFEKYYPEEDEDRQALGRAIYQLESVIHQKCIELRKRKELELTLLQQPIRNWNGETIENLGTLRLMTQLDIRAGREKNKVSGFGLAFSSAVVLITATERMSGFVLITNIPTSKAAAARHNEGTVEITGQTGHFWLEFENKEDATEWWDAMSALKISSAKPSSAKLIPSDRSSFTEPKKSETSTSRKTEEDSNVQNAAGNKKITKMAPVKLVPTRTAHAPPILTSSSSPPPIKSYQSTSTIHSSASSSFCPRPTPPCLGSRLVNATSPKHQKQKDHVTHRKSRLITRKTPENELRDHSRNRFQAPTKAQEPQEEQNVLALYRCYEENRTRKSSDPTSHGHLTQIMGRDLMITKSFHTSLENMVAPLRSEMSYVKDRLEGIAKENDLLRDQVKIMRRQLEEERAARRQLEARVFSWRQSFYDDHIMTQHDTE